MYVNTWTLLIYIKGENVLTHWCAGAAIMYIGSLLFGFNFSPGWLIYGALTGALPDIISLYYGFNYKKDSHLHRENWSHSILWYPVPLAIAWAAGGWALVLLTGFALFSHPVLDSFGLGFGIQIFYPFPTGSLYIRSSQRKIWYSQTEIADIISRENDNDWFKNIFLSWPSSRPLIFWTEILSIVGLVILIGIACGADIVFIFERWREYFL